jgi:chorismate dehydratase
MAKLRISAISYLNTAPLMWDFEHGDVGSEFDITYTLPSECAQALHQGRADIGIIPAAAYLLVNDLEILPGVAIASRRPVRSILLVSKVPVEKIRSVGLDTSSMTSVALTKVLFHQWGLLDVDYAPMAPDVDRMLAGHDAGLLIGDPALKIDRSRFVTYDLAEEWIRLTGKPFVFAFWVIRREALRSGGYGSDLATVFQDSRDHGLLPENVSFIAREWSPRVELSESDVKDYLTKHIYYWLDTGCLEGLKLFYRYAEECGALPHAKDLQFLDIAKALSK